MNKILKISDRIKIFTLIRDIPYRLANSSKDTSCISKTKILGEFFQRTGFEVRVAKCNFNWKTIGVPQAIINIRKKLNLNDASSHAFLRIFVPEIKAWASIDPTWDIGLKSKFPVATWDGLHSTVLAVRTSGFKEMRKKNGFITPDNLSFPNFSEDNKFISTFNQWLEKIRTKEK